MKTHEEIKGIIADYEAQLEALLTSLPDASARPLRDLFNLIVCEFLAVTIEDIAARKAKAH